MNLRDKIKSIASETIRNQINLVSTLRMQQSVQNVLGVVDSIDGQNAIVTFPDGSQTTATISTARPIAKGSYVVVVGSMII